MIRKYILLSFTLGTTLVFLIQLVKLQIFNPDYNDLSLSNAVEKRPIYPTRGLIYDRNGKLLVANQPVYDLMVIPENTSSFDTLELLSFLELSKEDIIKKLLARYKSDLSQMEYCDLSINTSTISIAKNNYLCVSI